MTTVTLSVFFTSNITIKYMYGYTSLMSVFITIALCIFHKLVQFRIIMVHAVYYKESMKTLKSYSTVKISTSV